MKRATITLPDDLERELERYLDQLDARPTLTSLVQAALRSFLEREKLGALEYRPPRQPLRITPAAKGSGKSNISVEHDKYLAEDA